MDGVNDFLAFLQYSTSLQVLFMGWMEILKVRLETRGTIFPERTFWISVRSEVSTP